MVKVTKQLTGPEFEPSPPCLQSPSVFFTHLQPLGWLEPGLRHRETLWSWHATGAPRPWAECQMCLSRGAWETGWPGGRALWPLSTQPLPCRAEGTQLSP